MRSRLRRLLALAAALTMTACASSAPPVTALQRPLPAAALQLCPAPPLAPGPEVDDVATTLMDMYGLYGQCAGLHADLVRAVESASP
jgi:predicted component of type VI protein secretion system